MRTTSHSLARTQRRIVAGNRFGIPAMVHEECLTGLAAWQATAYQSPLCWGATFEPELVRRIAFRIGTTMRRQAGFDRVLVPEFEIDC